MPKPFLSVIIPVGPVEEEVPQGLLHDLQHLPKGSELIFVVCKQAQFALAQSCASLSNYSVKWLCTEPGRAIQMNFGAQEAGGQYIWFLHLDSRFEGCLVSSLLDNLNREPERLHYCSLAFTADGPSAMPINALGANLRSRLLGVPFGDQGFLISKHLFEQVGGYPEAAAYGEDHLFVWYVRQQGIKLKCCSVPLSTSARKYEEKGWFKITFLYQRLWLKQAWPEFIKLVKQRYF
ncbi:hypothetical protein ACMXYV_01270 [Neptuniibacter sp. SY11_33]|uniref:hypothetical protein n=1 Tax=Neptuniibacter sp. SY11_33 TaxID=3398215 RepID=UPI0039F58634